MNNGSGMECDWSPVQKKKKKCRGKSVIMTNSSLSTQKESSRDTRRINIKSHVKVLTTNIRSIINRAPI